MYQFNVMVPTAGGKGALLVASVAFGLAQVQIAVQDGARADRHAAFAAHPLAAHARHRPAVRFQRLQQRHTRFNDESITAAC